MIRATKFKYSGTLLIIAAGLAAWTPAAVAAADEDALPQATLDTAHTDFTSAKALAHLRSQIRHASANICGLDASGSRLMNTDERRCYDTAMNSGLAQVESKHQLALRRTAVDVAVAQPVAQPAH